MTHAADHADAVPIVGLRAVACATLPWRNAGQLRLTVVVKATFAVVPDGDMTLTDPVEIHRADVPQRNSPTLSTHFARETAPYLQQADVILTGSAWAPAGAPAQAITVRFALFRERTLFEKSVHVYGDRRGAEIVAFEHIPLVYERAYGGLGHGDNPFGTGNKELSKPPNLVDPQDPTRPTCFAPLSTSWPTRKRLLSKAQHEGLRHPIPDIAADFDWSYFQAAPPDQRVAHLAGDEWVVLDGLHPDWPRVQSRLPGVHAAARVYGLSDAGRGQPLALSLDTLAVDADALTCSLVWRASFPVPSEDAFDVIRVAAGVETASAPIDWDAALAAAASGAEPVADEPASAPKGAPPEGALPEGPRFAAVASTIEIEPSDLQPTIRRKLTPEERAAGAAPPPGAAPVSPAMPSSSSASDWAGTVEISSVGSPPSALPFQAAGEPAPILARRPLPPPRPPPPASRPRPAPPPLAAAEDWAGTVEVSSPVAEPRAGGALPFASPQAPAPPPEAWGRTADAAYDQGAPAAQPRALPFVPGVAVLPPSTPVADHPFSGTVGLGDEAPAPMAFPFRQAPAPPREPRTAYGPPPPFDSPAVAPPAVAPPAAGADVEPPALLGGVATAEPVPAAEPPRAVVPLPAEVPQAPASPPEPSAPRATARRQPQRAAPPPPPPPAPRRADPPAPPPPLPKPNVNAGLYKRFDEPDK